MKITSKRSMSKSIINKEQNLKRNVISLESTSPFHWQSISGQHLRDDSGSPMTSYCSCSTLAVCAYQYAGWPRGSLCATWQRVSIWSCNIAPKQDCSPVLRRLETGHWLGQFLQASISRIEKFYSYWIFALASNFPLQSAYLESPKIFQLPSHQHYQTYHSLTFTFCNE